MKERNGAVQGAGSLLKSLDVLEVIANASEPPSVGQVASQMSLPRPTVHRIVSALEERGLVQFDPSARGFRLGFHLFELAHKAWADVDLRGIAREPLDRLRSLSREVVVLGVRAGNHFIVTDRRESLFGVRPAIAVGHMEPLTSRAFGLAILSELGTDAIAELDLGNAGGYGSDPTQAVRAFHEALHLAAARGYAIHVGDGDDGVASIAAPILDFLGRPIAALGVLGPASRFSLDQLHALAPDVIDAARRVTSNAGNSLQSIEPRPRPAKPMAFDRLESIQTDTLLGKTPQWRKETGKLYVADILGPSIIAADPGNGAIETITAPNMAVLCGWTKDGALVLADSLGIAHMDVRTGATESIAPFPDGLRNSRFNTGTIDPGGRIWLSSLHVRATPGDGSVFRMSNGRIEPILEDLSVPGGIAWTADGRRIYVVETAKGLILQAEFDPETGGTGPFSVFASINNSEGTPDGIAVDVEGAVWVALWDGWSIAKFDRNGHRDRTIVLPVPRPTDLCFGGKDGKTLFVTTARVRLSSRVLQDSALSGSILCLPVQAGGVEPTVTGPRQHTA